MATKKFLLIVAVAVLALVGLGLGLFFGITQTDGDSATGNNGQQSGADSNGDDGDSDGGSGSTPGVPGLPPTPTPSGTIDPSLPDPSTEAFDLHALAIGDWGTTQNKPGSCCNRYRQTGVDNEEYYKDYWAQNNIAMLLAESAGRLNPKVIIGHGDNFYWNGVGPSDVESRFVKTFEQVYNQPQLANIPWISVAGNHDMGGSQYICGERDNEFRPCNSITDLLQHLNGKFDLQSKYVSPNGDRWKMPAHYFKYTINEGNVSIDIYNVDTNYADSHGARQICCQCYGYSKGDDDNCNNIERGDAYCAGGDVGLYDACFSQLETWFDESLESLALDASSSTADWKIVNSHYSPHFHMGRPKMYRWFQVLEENNIQVFMNGHTHGENHDYGNFKTHFFENGAGGGIQSETSTLPSPDIEEVSNVWVGNNAPYGFFEVSASKEWLRMQFITFGSKWTFDKDPDRIVQGSYQVNHCWYIPSDGSFGRSCI